MKTNVLYYGDNLKILRNHEYFPSNSIDLIYLDPPFNSKATYNILFKEPTGERSQAQITAFDDTWHWGKESEKVFQDLVINAPMNVVELMSAFRNFIHQNDMMAYLVMMCIRLLELRRVLKETGGIYLHCDTTASHYLKILMDAIFGMANFRNEISWRRSQTRSSISRIFKRSHDILLFYSKSEGYRFNLQYKELSEASLDLYSREDGRGLHRLVPLVVSGRRNGETGQIWRDIDPNLCGKGGSHWVTKPSNLEDYDKQGLIVWPQKIGGLPQLKYYLEDNKGVPVTDFWDDIDIIPSSSNESMGYPTQKPESLLERVINSSSNEGDIILDPFCGCGTALVVAQKLKRKWIGIYVTHLAIGVMKYRLKRLFPTITFEVTGEPKDLSGARELAKDNKYEFQWWAVSLVGGQPYGDKKKGADTGIDGYIYFMDEKDKVKKAVVSVKGGHSVSVAMIRDLGHVIDREKAEIGIFICLEKPTRPMETEAVTKGFYHSPLGKDYPKIQILTVEELLNGKKPDIPLWIAPIQAPPRHKQKEGLTAKLFDL